MALLPSRRHDRRLHHHHTADRSASYYRHHGHSDEPYATGLVSVARGSRWNIATATNGAEAAGAFGYNARVTAVMTTAVCAAKGGTSDGGDESSEDGVLLPPPPPMAITKRTDVVVMR